MKKLIIILLTLVVTFNAKAQRKYMYRPHVRSHVIVALNRPFYSYYPGYFDPFYYPYHRYGYFPRETKLDLKVDNIRADYQDKIWSAKHDKSLTRADRKRIVHNLKLEREHAINEARRNYYKS